MVVDILPSLAFDRIKAYNTTIMKATEYIYMLFNANRCVHVFLLVHFRNLVPTEVLQVQIVNIFLTFIASCKINSQVFVKRKSEI